MQMLLVGEDRPGKKMCLSKITVKCLLSIDNRLPITLYWIDPLPGWGSVKLCREFPQKECNRQSITK